MGQGCQVLCGRAEGDAQIHLASLVEPPILDLYKVGCVTAGFSLLIEAVSHWM